MKTKITNEIKRLIDKSETIEDWQTVTPSDFEHKFNISEDGEISDEDLIVMRNAEEGRRTICFRNQKNEIVYLDKSKYAHKLDGMDDAELKALAISRGFTDGEELTFIKLPKNQIRIESDKRINFSEKNKRVIEDAKEILAKVYLTTVFVALAYFFLTIKIAVGIISFVLFISAIGVIIDLTQRNEFLGKPI